MFGFKPGESSGSDVDSGIYTKEASKITFDHLLNLSSMILESGLSVIVDATFLKRKDREDFEKQAREKGIRYNIIDCQISANQAKNRIKGRAKAGTDASEATVSVLETQLDDIDPLTLEEQGFALVFDMTRSLETQLARANSLLQETGATNAQH